MPFLFSGIMKRKNATIEDREHGAFATSGWEFYVCQLAGRAQCHDVAIITHPDRRPTSLLFAIPVPSNGDVTKREGEKIAKCITQSSSYSPMKDGGPDRPKFFENFTLNSQFKILKYLYLTRL